MTDGRTEFEQYAQQMGLRDFEETSEDGIRRYRNPFTEQPWNFWTTSRAALTTQAPAAGQNADEIEHLRSAAQQARTALSSLIASGDRVVYSDALRALDEALKNVHPTERHG